MNEPIHGSERLPTEEDSNLVEHVLVWSRNQWLADHYGNVSQGEWWKPIDQTPPPEPSKPKRRRWTHSNGNFKSPVESIEVLPTDPDWDELLDAVDAYEADDSLCSELMEVRNRNVK